MDLPPSFRYREHHQIRYENLFQSPDLFPPPFSPHLRPPSPLPPHVLPPPSLPPPHIAHPPLPPRIAFSPPRHPLPPLHYDYSLPPMTYPERDAFPPLPLRENFAGHGYLERNPAFEDENFRPGGLPENRFLKRNPTAPQDNFSMRLDRDCHDQNPILRDGVFHRGCGDGFCHPLSGKRHWNGMELDSAINRVGGHEEDWSIYGEREMYDGGDVADRRWYSRNDVLGVTLHDGSDDEKRWEYHRLGDQGWEFYNDRCADTRRLDACIDRVMSRVEKRQRVSCESYSSLSRFRGRLGRRVTDRDIVRSKEINGVQRKSALDRIQLGKASRWQKGGSEIPNLRSNPGRDRLSVEKEESFKCFGTRMKDEKERAQSSTEPAITFKSNTLGSKTVLGPCSPTFESDVYLSLRNDSIRKMNDGPISTSGGSNSEMVRTDPLTGKHCSQSESHVAPKERLDKSTLSVTGNVVASDAFDVGENAALDVPPSGMNLHNIKNTQPGEAQIRRRRNRRARKQPGTEIGQKMKQGNGKIIDTTSACFDGSFLHPKATTISEGNTLFSFADKITDAFLLPSLGCVVSERDVADNSPKKLVLPDLKRKRDGLTSSIDSVSEIFKVIPESTGRSERSIDIPEDAGHVSQLGTDEIKDHADETLLDGKNNAHRDGLCFTHHDNTDIVGCKLGSILGLEKCVIESDPERVADIGGHPFQGGTLSLENAFVKDPSEGMVTSEGHDITTLPGPQESMIPEIEEDTFVKEIPEPCSASDSEFQLLQKPFKVEFSVEECEAVYLLKPPEIRTSMIQVDATQLGADANHVKSLEAAAGDAMQVGGELPAHDLFPSCTKKRRVVSPRLALTNLQSDCSNLDQGSERLSKRGADNGEDTPIAIPFADKFSAAEMDACWKESPPTSSVKAVDYKLQMEDGVCSSPKHISVHVDGDHISATDSGDELIASDDDAISCPSSPEDLLSYTDFSCSNNIKASPSQLKNEIIYGLEMTMKRMPVSAKPNASSVWKPSVNANSGNPPASAEIGPSLRPDMLQRPNLVYGKLNMNDRLPSTGPKVFPCHSPLNFKAASKFPSTHVSKSRTWCRSTNHSVAVSGSNLPPCPLPQSHGTKVINNISTKSHGTKVINNNSTKSPGAKVINNISTKSHGTKVINNVSSSYIRKGNSLVRNPSPSGATPMGQHTPSSSVYRLSPSSVNLKKTQPSTAGFPNSQRMKTVNNSEMPEEKPVNRLQESSNSTVCLVGEPLRMADLLGNGSLPKKLDCLDEPMKSSAIFECSRDTGNNSVSDSALDKGVARKRIKYVMRRSNQLVATPECERRPGLSVNGSFQENLDALNAQTKSLAIHGYKRSSGNNSDSQGTLDEGNARERIKYVKRRSYQLVATSDSEHSGISGFEKAQGHTLLSDGYFKRKKNQLVRASWEGSNRKGDAVVHLNSGSIGSQANLPRRKRQPDKGFSKTDGSSKFSLVWKLHDAQLSDKHKKNSIGPRNVWPHILPWKRTTYRRNFMLALGSKSRNSFSLISQKLLLSKKRSVVYTRSIHGYSLRMSKVVSVNGSSLKWSKSMQRSSKRVNEEAKQAVAAAGKRLKEERTAVPIMSKTRGHVSRKSVLSVKLRPGERIFRIGSERYKMDPTRRTLYRITAEKLPSPAVGCQTEKTMKRSYVPRRLLIGNNEYVRVGNGNKLIRDPKKRTRLLASEKVRWSLRTARLLLAKKKQYCQFFTRFGKCNKDDGKCPYIHDPSKIAVCTKFLNGSCANPDCKLTHKIIPERMQDCSYFLKGLCSNENCPYRHVNVDRDSSVCESFLRGYCADGNECLKKHTYVCPAFEATGACPQTSTCKLHHPKKKTERKPTTNEQKIVRGRYFDGGLLGYVDCCMVATTSEKQLSSAIGKDDAVGCQDGELKFPDYISLDFSDGEAANTEDSKHVGEFPDYISLDVSDDEVGSTIDAERSV